MEESTGGRFNSGNIDWHFGHCRVLMDVEGHELLALTGAQEAIQKCRPVIAIEEKNNN